MKKVIYSAIIAIGILAAGCSKETPIQNEEDGFGVLTVSIQNSHSTSTRDVAPEPTQNVENTVLNYAVYVFNSSSGAFEASGIFQGTDPGQIDNLSTASAKRVVVLVNYDFANMPTITNYSELDAMALNIDSQIPDFTSNALFMSGETDGVRVIANTVTPVTINVDRVVAKVRLTSLTISPSATSDITRLVIQGISMQKVPYWAYYLGDVTYLVDPADQYTYAGGIAGGDVSVTVLGHLHDAVTLPGPYTPDTNILPDDYYYYYVFPNDAVDNEATLLTIYGTYDGQPAYYTFPINNETQTGGGASADGTYIHRNMIYDLNVTLTNLPLYADSPDAINEFGSIIVTVTPQPWGGNLIQNVTW